MGEEEIREEIENASTIDMYEVGKMDERQRTIRMLKERIEKLRKNMDKIDKEGDPSGIGRRLQFPNRYDELMLFKSKLKGENDD